MKVDRDWTVGTGGKFSVEQKDKKETTALLYLYLVEDARAWSASADAMACNRSFLEVDDMAPVGGGKTSIRQLYKRGERNY